MKNLALYSQLVHCAALLHRLQRVPCLAGFCQKLREFWLNPQISDDEILAILSAGNQTLIEPDFKLFCEFWSPALYDPARKQLSWLPAADKPTLSFYAEHIGKLKGQLLAALIQPKTLLDVTLQQIDFLPDVVPSGFIFHLSRCGSTLVSRSFALLTQCRVLSESPLLTQILLDSNLSETEKAKALRLSINLQGRLYKQERHLMIKWNAWDLQFWPLILSLYPSVAVLLLVREPLEILASHQKSAGFHMVRHDRGQLFPLLHQAARLSPLEYRSSVVQLLLKYGLTMAQLQRVLLIDYSELLPAICGKIAQWFGISLRPEDLESCLQSQAMHSKQPELQFKPDARAKQTVFLQQDRQLIEDYCQNLYLQSLSSSASSSLCPKNHLISS